ncbi:MAG: ABC transporter ATP-binding protein [Desulfatiglans sp.]|jgi:branched-chain amino acid transport system ATP-binding protein|nr:ABC transporter ATP-binding protein [Thermodesulfobacteriota bacterium]MEE4354699.1 ABC transporter ATP-binding protein [Desulfatiglans sp.]
MTDRHIELRDIFLKFGGLTAVHGVDLHLNKGEILGLIGPNGAGKTCIINCISGFYRPQKGSILFRNNELTKTPVHSIAGLGISRTFQNIELYTGLTTLENLMAARHILLKYGILAGTVFFGKAKREELRHRRTVEEVIKLLEIEDIRNQHVGALPYGLRKRVELGRALVQEPEILLLDEPMAGMNLEEKEDMVRFILDIHDLRGTSILLVEHDMGVVMDIADRLVVLDFGIKIAEGKPEVIRKDPQVLKAYLGRAH